MIELRRTGSNLVTAHDGDAVVGYLSWWPPNRLGGTHLSPVITAYELDRVEVRPDYQRRGIASALFDYARKLEPSVHHSPHMTAAGQRWSASMGYTPPDHVVVRDLGGEGRWQN